MNSEEIQKAADLLDRAIMEANEVERLTLSFPQMTVEDSYLIQDAGIQRRLSRGEKIIGYKMGLTSEAKRKQMNLDSPVYGVLTDQMEVSAGSTFSLAHSIHPKIEPEIAFRVRRDIRKPLSRTEALESCDRVFAAMEILDSRYLNFKYFSLPDVIADNCSSSYFVMSQEFKALREVNLPNLTMKMNVNGRTAEEASSHAISGDPLNSLVQLSEMLCARGLYLPAGSIVLAGAATQAITLEMGMLIELEVESLGAVSIRV